MHPEDPFPTDRSGPTLVPDAPWDDSDSVEAFLDGDLGPWERRRFEVRLRDEPRLAAELESARRVRDGLRALSVPACPEHVERAVLRTARAEANRSRPRHRAAFALAAVLLLALAAVVLLRVPGERSQLDSARNPPRDPASVEVASTSESVVPTPDASRVGSISSRTPGSDSPVALALQEPEAGDAVPPTDAEVAQAEAEVKLALAYLGRLGRTAELAFDGSLNPGGGGA